MNTISLHTKKYRSYFIIILPIFITIILWLFAKEYRSINLNIEFWPRYLSQIFALVGIVFFAQSYLLATRLPQIERFYGGMDKIYSIHSLVSKWGTVLILAHPLLLVIEALPNIELIGSLFIPFHKYNSFAQTSGIIALYFYSILVLITIFRFLPYQIWKFTHKLIGIPFFFAAYHGISAQSDVKNYWVLFYWIVFWIVVGVISYVYKTLLYDFFGPKYLYEITQVNALCDVYELYMKPLNRRMNFEPGQFVFTSFIKNPRIPSEQHPFSISSKNDEDILRLSFKDFGDYSHKLRNAKVHDKLNLYGPYGDFTSFAFSEFKKQVWIAGGIGVTPFLSMLYYETHNKDKKEILFYYSGKKEEDCVYSKEIQEVIETSDDRFKFIKHFSNDEGFLTAERIIKDLKGKKGDYVFLMCGPNAMTQNLSTQLIQKGIDKDYIIFEKFDFV